jgi:CheY-like chemotaxis protein
MACVLAIDDAAFLRTVLGRFLESAGHTVVEAEDGDAGVAAFKSAKPELVISDVAGDRVPQAGT